MKKRIIGIISLLLIICLVLLGLFQYHSFEVKSEDVIVNIHSNFDPKKNIKNTFFSTNKDVKITGNVDTSKIGTYKIVYALRNKQQEVKVHVKDLRPPVLKLKSYTTDMVEKVSVNTFVKSCQDDSKYHVTLLTKQFNQEGKHTIKVQAKDEYGNVVVKNTTLTRVQDKKGPTIQQVSEFVIDAGDSFDFEKAIVYKDDYDPNPTMEYDASKVNLNKAGTYPCTYVVKDRSQNTTTQTFNLVVKSVPESSEKTVYLTFDDGPSMNTQKILDILDQYDVKATFFVTGRNPDYAKFIQEANAKGHTIGLHTYTHDYAKVYASTDAYFEDLNQISQYVEKLIGKKPTAIRFPGGSSNTISANYSKNIMTKLTGMVLEKGYQYYDWNCDSTDASGNHIPVDVLVENATSSNAEMINILAHDTDAKDTTVLALPKIIEYYKSKGYSFKAITPESYAPHHRVNN